MSGIECSAKKVKKNPKGVPNPAKGSQHLDAFGTPKGAAVSSDITADRAKLNLTKLYGCAPATYCQYCQPFGAPGNIFTLLQDALSSVVVNETRKDNARLIIINTGSVRFDLAQGPFTYDDSFIVSPFSDSFQYIADVPYTQASKVLDILNAGPYQKKKRSLQTADFGFSALAADSDSCIDPPLTHNFATDGDDTTHSSIPHYPQPNDLQANASFPLDGSMPEKVDLVFLDFIASYIVNALNSADVGGNFNLGQVEYYIDKSFTTNSYLPAYAKVAWQKNLEDCPVGEGIGFKQ